MQADKNTVDILFATLKQKNGLQDHHINFLKNNLHQKTLAKKEYLIEEGSVCDFLAIVLSGTLRSFVRSTDEEYNNDFYFEGDFATAFTSYLLGSPTNCNIQALTDVALVYITKSHLKELMDADMEWLKLEKYVAESYFIRKCKRETSFLKATAAERFNTVLQLYPALEQRVSQYHIASYLGIKPESLSRIKLLAYSDK